MSGFYPPGTTEDDVNRWWASDYEQALMAEVRGWLHDDADWWRRFVKADDPGRRGALVEALYEDNDPGVTLATIREAAEDERDRAIRAAMR